MASSEKGSPEPKRFWVSPYALEPVAALGAHAVSRPREGLLLKVEFENSLVGYGDIHPWTELGDYPIARQITGLAEWKPSGLATRSIAHARLDAVARGRRESLFKGLTVPDSHALFTDATLLTAADIDRVVSQGFTTIKLKVGRDLAAEKQALEMFFGSSSLNPHRGSLQVRLDFNAVADVDTVRDWLLSLSVALRLAIEFCEDPTAWLFETWQDLAIETGVQFAIDRESSDVFAAGSQAPAGVILKPAVQDLLTFQNYSTTAFVTSYLDHPVGQMAAAYEAARLATQFPVGVCGLLSQIAYKPNAYSELLPARGPHLQPRDEDLGIGFTELLEKENWRAI